MKFRASRNLKVRSPKVRNQGFTLIEMVVVISLVLILLAIALPRYDQTITRAREAKLHENLVTLNKAIEEYSLDKKKAPMSLDDLVPGYVKFIPDDITGNNTPGRRNRKTRKRRLIRPSPASAVFTAVPMRSRPRALPIRVGSTRLANKVRR